MRAAIEKYATIGLYGGSGGTVVVAALSGQVVLLPIVVGCLAGALVGGAYGALRARFAS